MRRPPPPPIPQVANTRLGATTLTSLGAITLASRRISLNSRTPQAPIVSTTMVIIPVVSVPLLLLQQLLALQARNIHVIRFVHWIFKLKPRRLTR